MLEIFCWFLQCCPAPAKTGPGFHEFPGGIQNRPITVEPKPQPADSMTHQNPAGPSGSGSRPSQWSSPPPPPSRQGSSGSKSREPITAKNYRANLDEALALAEALNQVKSRRRAHNVHFGPAASAAEKKQAVPDDASSTSSAADLDHVGRHFQPDRPAYADPRSSYSSDGIRNSIDTFDEGGADEVVVETARQVRARDLTSARFRPAEPSPLDKVFALSDAQDDGDEDEDEEREDTQRMSTLAQPDTDSTYRDSVPVSNSGAASSDAAVDEDSASEYGDGKLSSGSSDSPFDNVRLSPPAPAILGQ